VQCVHLPETDIGNSERLRLLSDGILRFRPPNSWIVYDDKRWLYDEANIRDVLAQMTAMLIEREVEFLKNLFKVFLICYTFIFKKEKGSRYAQLSIKYYSQTICYNQANY